MADEKAAGSTSPGESFEPAMQRAREINEQIMEMARKAGHQMLGSYVRWLEEVAEQQRKIASGTPVSQMDWLAGGPLWQLNSPCREPLAQLLRELPGIPTFVSHTRVAWSRERRTVAPGWTSSTESAIRNSAGQQSDHVQ